VRRVLGRAGQLEVAVSLGVGRARLAREASGSVLSPFTELAASEAAFVDDLGALREAYGAPLRAALEARKNRSVIVDGVGPVDALELAERVFGAADAVYAHAAEVVLPAARAAETAGAWRAMFEARAAGLADVFATYVVAYASAWENLSKACAKDARLAEIVAAGAASGANPRKHAMGSFAIMPVQRIARYEILLEATRRAVEKEGAPASEAGFADGVADLERACALARIAAAEVNVSVAADAASHSLRLTVIAGRGLVDKDRSRFSLGKGKSDPYCVVLVDGKELGRTGVRAQTLDPDWGDAEEVYYLLVVPTSQVCVRIYDEDRFSADDPMGEVCVDVGELIGDWDRFFATRDAHSAASRGAGLDGGDSTTPREAWFAVTPTAGCRCCGRLQLSLSLETFLGRGDADLERRASMASAGPAHTHALYAWLPRAEDVGAAGAGPGAAAPDAYVVLTRGGREAGRTNVHHGSNAPRWRKLNAMHVLPVDATGSVDFECRDWRRRAEEGGGLLGVASIDLGSLVDDWPVFRATHDFAGEPSAQGCRCWVLLDAPGGKGRGPAGRLLLWLRLVWNPNRFKIPST